MRFRLLLFLTLLCFSTFANVKKKERSIPLSDSTQYVVNNIFVGGNKKTKERIITRELLIQQGDTIYKEHLDFYIEKSKENLLNTSLFNYITIKTTNEHSNNINLFVLVEERWYLWPYLVFEHADRNFSSFIHNKDWSRINYGLMLVKNNFRGRGETVKLKVRLGYKEQFQLAYEVPYITKNRKHGLSTDINWNRQNEISYITQNDKPVYYKDNNDFVNKVLNSRLTYTYRNKYYILHRFTGLYSYNNIQDTIVTLNNNYFGLGQNHTQYLGLNYNFILDKRNYRHYPLTGYNFEFLISQYGLNLLPNEMEGIWEFETFVYKYWEHTPRWHSGLGARAKISSNKKQPYFIEQGLGYKTFLRAFEYYVIDGQSFATTRSFIKYTLIPTQVKHIEAWNWSKFNKVHYSLYINAFVDLGYVKDAMPNPSNKLPNTYLTSTGIGIDLVAYYDQIIRFEYSLNRLGEHGFFIHIGKAF